MNKNTTIDQQEVDKFSQHAAKWWDLDGPLKTLHDLNPTRLEYINQFIKLKGQRILDLGCGGGILTESLASAGAIVTGLDVEKNTIECAAQHAKFNNLLIDYICQPVENYVANDKFSCITCMEMLEHVADPAMVIHYAAKLLAPNGYIFFSTINRTMMAYSAAVIAAEYILGLLPRQTHDYKKFIKPSELAALARKENLSLVGMSGISYNPFTRKSKLTDNLSINYLCVFKLKDL